MKRNKRRNPIDALLDEEYDGNIFVYDQKGIPVEFEQIGVLPIEEDGEEVVYCILHPVKAIIGAKEDEAFVYKIVRKDDEGGLERVEDEDKVKEIFDFFNKACEELMYSED